jgi:hypothetical protein
LDKNLIRIFRTLGQRGDQCVLLRMGEQAPLNM